MQLNFFKNSLRMKSATAAVAGVQCLLSIESDNGHPACTKCLISSHGCPNCIARTALVREEADPLDKRQGEGGSVSCQTSAGICASTASEAKRFI